MVAGDAPRDVDVPLGDADELRLYVDDAADGIASDHAIWAMARIE